MFTKRLTANYRWLGLLAALAIGSILAACAAPAGGGSSAETEAPAEPQILRVGWGGATANLDPLYASADTEIALLNAVYDYLLDTNQNNELVPRLATDWSGNEEGTQYTLTLADGVNFHNGDPLTVDDIIWTFDRLKNEDPESATAGLFASLDSVAAGDGNTVVFTLSEPNPDFLYNLTDNHAVILQANAQNIGTDFNGTGPFTLDEFVPEDRAVLSANPDYFGGAPAVDGLEFLYFADNDAAVNALRGGTIDAVLRIDIPTFVSLQDEPGFNAVDIPTNGHDLIRLRADMEPGNDPLVREAFKLATDRQAIFERTQFGLGAPGRDTPIGPLYSQYYTEEFPLPEYDPAKARDLLTQAGYADGLDMTLTVPNARDLPALAEVLAAQWAEAGINVTIDVQEEAQYYSDGGWLDVPLAITPWGSRPVPQLYLDLAYKTGAQWNEAHFSDAELDQQIEIAGTSTDPATRVAAYKEIQRILIERGPVIIPYFFPQVGVFSDRVGGVELNPFAGRTNFNKATLSQ